MVEEEKRPQAEAPDADEITTESAVSGTGRISEALDRIETALEKPLLPLWERFKGLNAFMRFLSSFIISLLAACLVFMCFLPGIRRTAEKNRAAEAALQEVEPEPVYTPEPGPAEDEIAAQKIAEYKHARLTEFLSSEYSIMLRSGCITLTPEQLSSLYRLEETESSYYFVSDRDTLKDFLAALCAENEPDPVAVKYINTAKTRETVYYPEDETGFTPDIGKAAGDLAGLIFSGKGGTVEMEYFGSAFCDNRFKKFNGTGIEVSIDNQYLWLYMDGKLEVETPIVSGDIRRGDATPRGNYKIYWITTDTYLKGRTWNDYVSHWAPFYKAYGIHDARWRTEFGGDIYKTDGSHGCVNVPIEAMNKIASLYFEQMPVVVY